MAADTVELASADNDLVASRLSQAGYNVKMGSDAVVVFTPDGESQVARLIDIAATPIRNVHVHRPTLDDVFLHFTGRQIRDEHAERTLPMAMRARARHR
ncbi:MAG: hypothetical protein M0Z95_07290 [Actinomycetota bacterium]|nr:hypothetical protein [Actinomycetota bacterium]